MGKYFAERGASNSRLDYAFICLVCSLSSTQSHRFQEHLSLWMYVKSCQLCLVIIVLGKLGHAWVPGRIKTCLYTEFFIFREVPHNLKNEAKNVMISVERHGEMRQGTKCGSEFKFKKRRRKSVFRCIAASVPRSVFLAARQKPHVLGA